MWCSSRLCFGGDDQDLKLGAARDTQRTQSDGGRPGSRRGGPGAGAARLEGAVLIVALHATAVAIATHPAVLGFRSAMPPNPDAFQHLWIMHWYKTCLLEGRSVLLCPEIQSRISMVGKWTLIREDNPAFFPVPFDAREGPFWSDRSPAFLVIAGAS